MANTVYWRLEIERANEEALALFSRFKNQAKDRRTPEQIRFVDLFDDPDEIIRNLDLPKWNYCEDLDAQSITGGSAYDYPDEGFKRLMLELSKMDANLIASFTYTDEAMQLAGAGCFVGATLKISERMEYDEIESTAIEQYGDGELNESMEAVVDKMQADVADRARKLMSVASADQSDGNVFIVSIDITLLCENEDEYFEIPEDDTDALAAFQERVITVSQSELEPKLKEVGWTVTDTRRVKQSGFPVLCFICTPSDSDEASWTLNHFDDRLLEMSAEVGFTFSVSDLSATIYQAYCDGDHDSGMILVDDFEDENYIEVVDGFRAIYAGL